MSVLLFVIFTIIVGLTVDHFLHRKKQNEIPQPERAKSLSLSEIIQMLPKEVFLQPTFTWSKILDTGNLMLGIHPVILELTGEPTIVETLQPGDHVKKGETFITLHKDYKQLHLKTPVTGKIIAVNPDFYDATGADLGRTWLYAIKPEYVSSEIPQWFVAEKSHEWLKEKFQQIKNFFIQKKPQKEMGLTMADGGELPIGVLSEFDKET